MNKKMMLIGAALGGLMLAATSASTAFADGDGAHAGDAPPSGAVMGECHGVNSCKGTGDCGGKGHSCAGKNSCKGQGWVKASKTDCTAKGGEFKG